VPRVSPEATKVRQYKDKPGKWVPVTPGHTPHTDAEGKPVEYEERSMNAREAIQFAKMASQANMVKRARSPYREELLRRARIL
jgi:hypothetical protein